MTAAWITLAVIAVGLPLLAWWVAGRRLWARADERGRTQADVRQEIRWLHGLTPQEATSVEDAVQRGRALDDERLRAAAVDWAERVLAGLRGRAGLPNGIRGFLVVFWGLYAVVGVAAVAFDMATGKGVPWMFVLFAVNGVVGVAGPLLSRRSLQRAIELNGGRRTPE